MTNSLYVDLPAQSGPVIFFASGYSAFYFKPLLNLIESFDIELQDNDCFATSLEYIGEWDVLIYCDNGRAVYVDINQEFIYDVVEYARDGRPYICPNPDIYLAVYPKQEYIVYALRSTKQVKNFKMSGSSFDNGVCLGSQNVTLFAFTTRERGMQVLNASAGSIASLLDTMCANHPCQPFVVLQDRYLVIRENRRASWYTSVLDSHNNFSVVLGVQSSNIDLMAIIEVDVFENENTTPSHMNESVASIQGNESTTSLQETTKQNNDAKYSVHKTVAIIVTPIAILAGLFPITTVLILTLYCRKRQCGTFVSSPQDQERGPADNEKMIRPKLPVDENRAKMEVETH